MQQCDEQSMYMATSEANSVEITQSQKSGRGTIG